MENRFSESHPTRPRSPNPTRDESHLSAPTAGSFRPALYARTVPVSVLSPTTRERMWWLFDHYYADVTHEGLEADLADKTSVILLYDKATGRLEGFSTIKLYCEVVHGRRIGVFYSGDTIVDRAYWGQTALQRAWLAAAMRFKLANPHLAVYWFLITKGYKTYLLLTRNFPEHWPRHDLPTPPFAAAVIDVLARAKFDGEWKPGHGVIQHERPCGRLRATVAPIDEAALNQPDVRFFAEKNPGYARGDELCCIGKIDLALCRSYLGKLGRRALRKAISRWGASS